MRTFREQFIECKDNGNHLTKKLEKPQIIESFCHGSIIVNTIGWCKRFNYQCTSETCKCFRQSISLN